MEQEKLSTGEVAQAVHTEGLAHAVTTFVAPDRIADPELAGLWAEARVRLQQIEELLLPHYGD